PSNPGSTILMHRQPDDVWRIDYQLRDDEDPEVAARPEAVIPRIEAHLSMIGERRDWSPIWISLYRANALTARRYVQGRCVLAGDAAHLVPIFGVRGANSGFEDAHALGWRLAYVMKGLAPASILESYSRERVQAAHDNLAAGMKSTEFMSPPSFAFELMRTAVLSLAGHHPWVRSLINPRQTQASAYRIDPQRLPAQEREFERGPAPGQVTGDAPVTLLREGGQRSGHLTKLLGPRFTLLLFSSAPVSAELRGCIGAIRKRGVDATVIPVAASGSPHTGTRAIDSQGVLRRDWDATDGSAWLVRPDGHVLARWRRVVASEVRQMIDGELQ
ncbi:MAG: FAD-dependent monooxygenase, partial [Steroidobacteraceae bacterium]